MDCTNGVVLLQTESILKSTWPVTGPIDDKLIQASEYLMEAAHSFRLQKKNYFLVVSRKNKHATTSVVDKPNKAIIWIAKTFPPWQSTVLSTILELYQVRARLIRRDVVDEFVIFIFPFAICRKIIRRCRIIKVYRQL